MKRFAFGLFSAFSKLFSRSSQTFQYNLAAVAIFQNEAPWLKEWIEFHLLAGIEHFYLYNHESSDGYLEVLSSYIERGVVTLDHIKKGKEKDLQGFNKIQCFVYTKSVKKLKNIAKWVAFLDVDEYLFSVKKEKLTDVLKRFEAFSGVAVNWQMFGTSGVKSIAKGSLLIESLTCCAPKEHPVNRHIKSIVKPKHVRCFKNPHFAIYKRRCFQVNTDGTVFSGAFSPCIQIDTLRINHYWSRDENYLNTCKIPRQKKWGIKESDVLKTNDSYNESRCSLILAFAPSLKEKLFLKEGL